MGQTYTLTFIHSFIHYWNHQFTRTWIWMLKSVQRETTTFFFHIIVEVQLFNRLWLKETEKHSYSLSFIGMEMYNPLNFVHDIYEGSLTFCHVLVQPSSLNIISLFRCSSAALFWFGQVHGLGVHLLDLPFSAPLCGEFILRPHSLLSACFLWGGPTPSGLHVPFFGICFSKGVRSLSDVVHCSSILYGRMSHFIFLPILLKGLFKLSSVVLVGKTQV